jgi:coproporphyrinogen III oxidase-like Fe-S oxidoreductase
LRLVALLIDVFLRRANRRVLSFSEAEEVPVLPPPDPRQRYLLYLHVPYCRVLCPFCSFHRVRFSPERTKPYYDSLRREIRIVSEAGYVFDELYVGGGTPTVMADELLRTLDLVRSLHPVRAVSIETNPDDIGCDDLRRLCEAGVNRVSVGVQSFDDPLLREMQRLEPYGSGADIAARLEKAQGAVDTLNIDMIFNLPHQDEASLDRDLDILTSEIGAEQVSWYPLMTAASTRRAMRKDMGRVDYSRERRYYERIVARMTESGYSRDSAWCFSRRPGLVDEYIVDHDEYLGLGSGAFSYLQGSLYASTFSLNHYGRLVADGKPGLILRREMGERDRMRYYLLMRLFAGSLDIGAAEQTFGGRFRSRLRPELEALRLIGAVRSHGQTLRLTASGYYLRVRMMRAFFSSVSVLRDEMRQHIADEHAALGERVAAERLDRKATFGKPQ